MRIVNSLVEDFGGFVLDINAVALQSIREGLNKFPNP